MEVGAQVGAYKLVHQIGHGGMGTVWLAQHTRLGRTAAIKLLHPQIAANADALSRFFREAQAAAKIRDPGIVQIFDFGDHEGTAYIAMEHLVGEELEKRLRRLGKLAPADALRIMRQVASAVGVAHALGIVHRDLKPGNIFLVRDPEVIGGERAKVLDFGIAKLADGQRDALAAATATNIVMGTPTYMSPEQSRGSGRVDARSDVYSLGCVLFELIAGTPPFAGEGPGEIVAKQIFEAPPRLSARLPISPKLSALIERCLAKEPAQRFASGAALAEAIESFGSDAVAEGPSYLPEEESDSSDERGAPDINPRDPSTGSIGPAPTAHTPSSPSTSNPPGATVSTPPTPWMSPEIALEPPWISIELPTGIGATPRGFSRVHTIAAVFDAAVPARFRDSLGPLVEFFSELFASARPAGDHVVQLDEPMLDALASRAHYVLFLDDLDSAPAAPLAELSTMMFRAQVTPLAERLASHGTPPGSVLITVLMALQLGQGARETIFTLRRDHKLFVVPIAASEIRRACEGGSVQPLLLDRIADLHPVSDPFAVVDKVTDPTRCIGFAAEVSDLVKHIAAGGRLISVAGPPGSGKTSVVAMAEYGCDTSHVARRFVRLSCSDLHERDPVAVIEELHERVRRVDADDGARGARGSDPPPVAGATIHATVMQLAPPSGLARRHQLVIVLEDADWLIRLASSAEPDATRRDPARELWRSLAQLCSSGGHTVIVTSIRDFQDQLPFERPVSVARVPLRALTRRESDRVVTSLGELVGFSPRRRALAALYRASGGNVYALRLLCSRIIRSTRERPDYDPLARLVVTPKLVRDAVRDVAATGTTFRSHVSIWLDDSEKVVLQHIARERPRSPRQIWRALEGSADTAQIEKALDSLEHMGLVESRGGRHRVRVPVLERWITNHLDAPPLRRRAIRQERISWIALGCTVTALLFGAYWTWLRSTRSVEAATIDDCRFELDSPDRVGPDDTLELFVYQDCKTPRHHDLALEPVLSSLTIPAPASNCSPISTSCTTSFKAVVGQQAHDIYQIRLRVDGRPLVSTAIQKDAFASMRAIGEKTVPAIAFLPLLLSVAIAFHKDMRRQVAALFHRGDPPDPP